MKHFNLFNLIIAVVISPLFMNAEELKWLNEGELFEVSSVSLSPDKKYLVYKDKYDYTKLKIWDLELNLFHKEIDASVASSNIPVTITSENIILYYDITKNEIIKYDIQADEWESQSLDLYIFKVWDCGNDKFLIQYNKEGYIYLGNYDFASNSISNEMQIEGTLNKQYYLSPDRSEIYFYPPTGSSGMEKYSFVVYDRESLEEKFKSEDVFNYSPDYFYFEPNTGNIVVFSSGYKAQFIGGTMVSSPFSDISVWNSNKEQLSLLSFTGRVFIFFGFSPNAEELYFHEERTNTLYTYNYVQNKFTDSSHTNLYSPKLLYYHADAKIIGSQHDIKEFSGDYSELLGKTELLKSEQHLNTVTSVAQLDADRVISGSIYGYVKTWDIESGDFIEDYFDLGAGVNHIGVSHNMKYLGICTDREYNKFLLYDIESKELLIENEANSTVVNVKFSYNDKYAVVSYYNDDLQIFDLETMQIYNTFDVGPATICAEIIDENRVITAIGKSIQVFDYHSGERLDSIKLYDHQYSNSVQDIQLSPDRSKISITSADGVVRIFDTDINLLSDINYSEMESWNNLPVSRWSNDSKFLVILTGKYIVLWDPVNNAIIHKNQEMESVLDEMELLTYLDLSDNNKLIFTASEGGDVAAFNSHIVSSIDEIELEYFEIFPNPSADFINIQPDFIYDRIEIYSISGEMKISSNEFNNKINISKLQSGTYYVQMMNNGRIKYGKFLKK